MGDINRESIEVYKYPASGVYTITYALDDPPSGPMRDFYHRGRKEVITALIEAYLPEAGVPSKDLARTATKLVDEADQLAKEKNRGSLVCDWCENTPTGDNLICDDCAERTFDMNETAILQRNGYNESEQDELFQSLNDRYGPCPILDPEAFAASRPLDETHDPDYGYRPAFEANIEIAGSLFAADEDTLDLDTLTIGFDEAGNYEFEWLSCWGKWATDAYFHRNHAAEHLRDLLEEANIPSSLIFSQAEYMLGLTDSRMNFKTKVKRALGFAQSALRRFVDRRADDRSFVALIIANALILGINIGQYLA